MEIIVSALATIAGVILGAYLSTGGWANQKRWEVRKDLYLELIKNLDIAKQTLEGIYAIEELSHIEDGKEAERDKRSSELFAQNKEVSENVRNAVNRVGILFSSEEVIQVLNTYLNAENDRIEGLKKAATQDNYAEISAEIHSWDMYLDNELSAANRAFVEIVNLAKNDLRIVIEPSSIWQIGRGRFSFPSRRESSSRRALPM